MLERVACNICGSEESGFMFVDNSYNLVRCKRCGLVYVNPRPSIEELRQSYMDEMFMVGDEAVIDRSDYIAAERSHLERARNLLHIVENHARGGKILDVGCGGGSFVKACEDNGWDAFGMDLSHIRVSYARNALNLNVVENVLKALPFRARSFDVVTMFDTLSHLPNPTGSVREIARVLRKDGLFVLKTGNKGALAKKRDGEWGYDGWNTPEHLYHFSPQTLSLFLRNDFEIVEVITINIMVDRYLSTKALTSESCSKLKRLTKLVLLRCGMLRHFLLLVSTKVFPSASLIVVARKLVSS